MSLVLELIVWFTIAYFCARTGVAKFVWCKLWEQHICEQEWNGREKELTMNRANKLSG